MIVLDNVFLFALSQTIRYISRTANKMSIRLFSMILWQIAIKTCVLYKMALNLKALFEMDGLWRCHMNCVDIWREMFFTSLNIYSIWISILFSHFVQDGLYLFKWRSFAWILIHAYPNELWHMIRYSWGYFNSQSFRCNLG